MRKSYNYTYEVILDTVVVRNSRIQLNTDRKHYLRMFTVGTIRYTLGKDGATGFFY